MSARVGAHTHSATVKPAPKHQFTEVHTSLSDMLQSRRLVPLNLLTSQLTYKSHSFNVSEWNFLLQDCPDRENVEKTIHGLIYGENLGFKGPQNLSVSPNSNLDDEQQLALREDLKIRIEAGQILGPFPTPPSRFFRSSRIHMVPKSRGRWRTVHDLSHPRGNSVNDGIDISEFDCKLCNLDTAIDLIIRNQRGCSLLKFDLRAAYHQICLDLSSLELCGFFFDENFFVETRLPFGARSSCSIFCRYADQFEWILRHHYGFDGHICHYADDFLVVCPPSSAEKFKRIFKCVAVNLGIDLEVKKEEGPSASLGFLGILLDTEKMEARIPPDKLLDILDCVKSLRSNQVVTVRALQITLGKINFVSRVVKGSRTFIGRLLEPLRRRKLSPSTKITLKDDQLLDLDWWIYFLPVYNGVSVFQDIHTTDVDQLHIVCDACTESGGASWGVNWFFIRWEGAEKDWDISTKELAVIVRACSTWGRFWTGKRIMFHTDNIAAMTAIQKRFIKSKSMTYLLRCLFFVEAQHSFTTYAKHLPGVLQIIADPLSRANFSVFRDNFYLKFGYYPNDTPVECIWPVLHELI
jgi:hypothetical protein